MTFELFCATLIALLFGTIVCFGGYRLFLILLPIWGFFFGFGLGAQSVQMIFGDAFLATATSWVVGFFVALLFAVLSYLFYFFAVAIIAGSLGYGLGVAIMGIFSADLDIITWIVGIVLAIVVIVVTFRFNLAKYVIIIATALGGAAATIATLVVGVENVQLLTLFANPMQTLLDASFFWSLLFVLMAGAGIAMQIAANRNWEVANYNRWEEMQAPA
ncbi:MAG: DUF4203 domain-containing protein [Anaerolineae bacterium]|nr:DUF4203 domain-containing protein [Anaerolineae bacterium]